MTHNNQKINIAIDGPAGAGKSTVARLVANALGYVYVDTGAMYRAVTWKSLQAGITVDQHDAIIKLTKELNIELIPKEHGQHVNIDGQNVTEEIRSTKVNQQVSAIAQIEEVRKLLVNKQKQMASAKGVVMDGRDIATDVLPDAEVKIYLTASVQERAKRRFNEMKENSLTLEQLEYEISRRDEMDKNREISPLIIAKEAVVVDCTNLSIKEVVETILDLCRTKMGGEQ